MRFDWSSRLRHAVFAREFVGWPISAPVQSLFRNEGSSLSVVSLRYQRWGIRKAVRHLDNAYSLSIAYVFIPHIAPKRPACIVAQDFCAAVWREKPAGGRHFLEGYSSFLTQQFDTAVSGFLTPVSSIGLVALRGKSFVRGASTENLPVVREAGERNYVQPVCVFAFPVAFPRSERR